MSRQKGSGVESETVSLLQALRALFLTISAARRRRLIPLTLLMLAGAGAELATLGALLPFLAVMANPEGSTVIKAMKPLFRFFGAEQQTEMVIVLTGLFATTAVASGGLRLALLWASNAYANGMAYELAVKLYDNVLHEPY